MANNYQGFTHTAPDTEPLVLRIADKAQEIQLQTRIPNRQESAKAVPDLRSAGRTKFLHSSLATFNKKIRDGIEGHAVVDEKDELPPMAFDNTVFMANDVEN
jgi:hypothetical protein